MISTLAGYVETMLDRVTASYIDFHDIIVPPANIRIHEERGGGWREEPTGSRSSRKARDAHVSIKLNAAHFLILTLPLPIGAKPYLNAVVASQIDRISPWSAERAVFGTIILEDGNSDLTVRVAIASRDDIARRLSSLDLTFARSVTLEIQADQDEKIAPILIPFETRGRKNDQRERQVISAITFGTLALVILAQASSIGFGYAIAHDSALVRAETAALRDTIAGASAGRDFKADPLARMINSKTQLVPVIETLNAMSDILPDHTYLKAFETEPTKLQIEGVSTAVTDLPRAISGQAMFGEANFTASIAKNRDGAGETFQLEIAIKPREGLK